MRSTAVFRRCLYGLGLFLLPMPIFLLAGGAAGIGTALLLPLAAALLLGTVIRRLPVRFRLLCTGLSVAVCFVLAAYLGRNAEQSAWRWAGAAFSALAAALYARYVGPVLRGDGNTGLWYAGLALDAVCWLISAVMVLREVGTQLRLYTWVYCVFLIFALTLSWLEVGVGSGSDPSRAMVGKNMLAALVWSGLFLLLTHIPQIMNALRTGVNALKRAVIWLIGMLGQLLPSGTMGNGGSGGGSYGMLAGDTQEPSWWMVVLEKIFIVISLLLAAAALILFLRLVRKALLKALRILAARIREYMNAVNESYEDQVESLLDWGEVKRGFETRLDKQRQKRADRVPWDRLSPRDQVRRSYRVFLTRHPEVPDGNTARQTLSDPQQTDIYEAARYSSREITEEEARSVREFKNQ